MVYLLGYRDRENDGAKPGLDVGMSVTSDMYKEIMKEDEIIIPLSKPNVLYGNNYYYFYFYFVILNAVYLLQLVYQLWTQMHFWCHQYDFHL